MCASRPAPRLACVHCGNGHCLACTGVPSFMFCVPSFLFFDFLLCFFVGDCGKNVLSIMSSSVSVSVSDESPFSSASSSSTVMCFRFFIKDGAVMMFGRWQFLFSRTTPTASGRRERSCAVSRGAGVVGAWEGAEGGEEDGAEGGGEGGRAEGHFGAWREVAAAEGEETEAGVWETWAGGAEMGRKGILGMGRKRALGIESGTRVLTARTELCTGMCGDAGNSEVRGGGAEVNEDR